MSAVNRRPSTSRGRYPATKDPTRRENRKSSFHRSFRPTSFWIEEKLNFTKSLHHRKGKPVRLCFSNHLNEGDYVQYVFIYLKKDTNNANPNLGLVCHVHTKIGLVLMSFLSQLVCILAFISDWETPKVNGGFLSFFLWKSQLFEVPFCNYLFLRKSRN